MSTSPDTTPRPDNDSLAAALRTLGARWGWFVALGAVLIVLGAIASIYVLSATLVSVLFVGILMLVGGLGQLLHAWRVKNWSGFFFWTISGVLYAGAGILAIVHPLAGAAILTLLLGATLIGAGALRLWIWFNHRAQRDWQWIALSGLITLAAGILVAAGWPGNSVWILGLLLALDLFFQGWAMVFLGLGLRRRQS